MNEPQKPPRQVPVFILWLGLIIFVLLAAAVIGRNNDAAAILSLLA